MTELSRLRTRQKRCGQAAPCGRKSSSFGSSLGPNLYSDFVLKNGYRPDPAQAATIGRVIGHRVKAADGSLQPAPTRAEKAAAGRAKKRSRKDVDGLEQILRLRRALASLAQNDRDPADIIHYIDPLFDDVLVIREQLAHAVNWINQFAEEWERDQKASGNPRSI